MSVYMAGMSVYSDIMLGKLTCRLYKQGVAMRSVDAGN